MSISLPAPWDLEYVPGMKEQIKDLGGQWDPDSKLWVLPEGTELPHLLQQYKVK